MLLLLMDWCSGCTLFMPKIRHMQPSHSLLLVDITSPPGPHSIASPEPSKSHAAFPFVHRSLRNRALCLDALYHFVQLCFNYNAAHNQLAEGGMKGLKIENEVQFANILEQAVEGLYIHLDQVEQGERRFGRCGNDDEV